MQQTNTETTERQIRKKLARPGFKTLSLQMLNRYIAEGRLPKPVKRGTYRYYKLADIERLLYAINRPTEIITRSIYPLKVRKCFINAGLG
jgi:hypothetical protein